MLHIAEMPEFTIDAFEGVLERGLKDLEESTNTGMARARLWADSMSGGVMSDTIEKQKEKAKRKLRIIREFNEHERRVPKLLDRRARKAIASTLDLWRPRSPRSSSTSSSSTPSGRSCAVRGYGVVRCLRHPPSLSGWSGGGRRRSSLPP